MRAENDWACLRFANARGCPWHATFLSVAALAGKIKLLTWAIERGAPTRFDASSCIFYRQLNLGPRPTMDNVLRQLEEHCDSCTEERVTMGAYIWEVVMKGGTHRRESPLSRDNEAHPIAISRAVCKEHHRMRRIVMTYLWWRVRCAIRARRYVFAWLEDVCERGCAVGQPVYRRDIAAFEDEMGAFSA